MRIRHFVNRSVLFDQSPRRYPKDFTTPESRLFKIPRMLASKVFVFAVCCIAASHATSFTRCEKGNPPKELRIKGCDSEPCPFYRGEDATAEWDFSIVGDAASLKPKVLVTAYGATLPYSLPEQDACKSLTNGECPVDKGEEVTYALRMPVRNIYPKIGLVLEFSILDEAETVHVCFKINANVVDR